MKKIIVAMLLIYSMLNAVVIIPAGSIVMDSGYVQVGVSADGTFGVGSNDTPGLLYDQNGEGNYTDDFLTPGSAWEFFIVKTDNIVLMNNNTNYTNPQMPTTISGDANYVTAVSDFNQELVITQNYTLDVGSTVIKIDITISNESNHTVSNVRYARGIDPDVDVETYNFYETVNSRGLTLADGTVIPENDIIIAEGNFTKKVLAYYTNSPFEHNTSIRNDWETDPDSLLNSSDPDSTSDATINLAFNFGDIAPGEEVTITIGLLAGENKVNVPDILTNESILIDNVVKIYNDNPNVPSEGNAPAYGPLSILLTLLLFGLLSYRKNRINADKS